MSKDSKWLITITYDGGNGKFEYDSDQPDSHLAVAVATKEMFKQCVFLDPKTTRISAINVDFGVKDIDSGDQF